VLYIVKTGAHSLMDGSNGELFDNNEFKSTEECPSVVVSFPSQVVCNECKGVESPVARGVGPK
jgi:hypothetical protein